MQRQGENVLAQSSVMSAICGAESTGFGHNLRVSQRNVGAKIMGVVAQSSVTSAICGAQNTGFGHNPRLHLRNLRLLAVACCLLYFKQVKMCFVSGIRGRKLRF